MRPCASFTTRQAYTSRCTAGILSGMRPSYSGRGLRARVGPSWPSTPATFTSSDTHSATRAATTLSAAEVGLRPARLSLQSNSCALGRVNCYKNHPTSHVRDLPIPAGYPCEIADASECARVNTGPVDALAAWICTTFHRITLCR